jgi:signal transduction histidine kinase
MIQVMCDPTRLVQVLTNLSSNGLQYTSAGGTVELQLETVEPTSQRTLQRNKPEQVTVRFSVHDNGRGMSAAEVP